MPVLRYDLSIFLDGLQKATEIAYPHKHINSSSPTYKAKVLII
jgi:hypothetical protein